VLGLLTSLEIMMVWRTPQGQTRRIRSHLWLRGAIAEELDSYADLFGANRVGDPEDWDPVAFAYAPGYFFADPDWRRFNKNVALIGAGLLKLGIDNFDKWAVLVGGYLAIQSRINGYRPLKRKVRLVMEGTGLMEEISKNRQPGRAREKLDRALERLKSVGVIKDFEFTSRPEDVDPDDLNNTKTLDVPPEPTQWAGAWLDGSVLITWPDYLRQRAKELEKRRQKYATAKGEDKQRKLGHDKKS
jgi:hypothetical protein